MGVRMNLFVEDCEIFPFRVRFSPKTDFSVASVNFGYAKGPIICRRGEQKGWGDRVIAMTYRRL